MKALIISFFNSSNIGDCILSNSLLELFNDTFECKKISYTLQPFEYTDIHNVKPITLNPHAGIKNKIIKNLNSIGLHRLTEEYYWRKKYVSSENKERIRKLVKNADIVIIGGGNMIFDLMSGSLSAGRFNYYAQICKEENKPLFACCIGIGPFNNNNQTKKAICALNKAATVSFRDEKSFRLYIEGGGKNGFITTDPAFLFKKNSRKIKDGYIAINIIDPSAFTNNSSEISNIRDRYKTLVEILSNKYKIKIFTTDIRDYDFAVKIADKKAPITNIDSIEKIYTLYDNSSIVIGSRMHSMILALTQDKPVVGLKWQNKVGELFKYMKLKKYCHNIETFEANDIERQIETIMERDYDKLRSHISNKVAQQRKALLKNIDVAKSIIEEQN